MSEEPSPLAFETALGNLDVELENCCEWSTNQLILDVVESLDDDASTVQLNIIDTLGHNIRHHQKQGLSDSSNKKYWLPPLYNANNKEFCEQCVIPYAQSAANEQGFSLVCRQFDKRMNKLTWVCRRGRPYQDETKKLEKRRETLMAGTASNSATSATSGGEVDTASSVASGTSTRRRKKSRTKKNSRKKSTEPGYVPTSYRTTTQRPLKGLHK